MLQKEFIKSLIFLRLAIEISKNILYNKSIHNRYLCALVPQMRTD